MGGNWQWGIVRPARGRRTGWGCARKDGAGRKGGCGAVQGLAAPTSATATSPVTGRGLSWRTPSGRTAPFGAVDGDEARSRWEECRHRPRGPVRGRGQRALGATRPVSGGCGAGWSGSGDFWRMGSSLFSYENRDRPARRLATAENPECPPAGQGASAARAAHQRSRRRPKSAPSAATARMARPYQVRTKKAESSGQWNA